MGSEGDASAVRESGDDDSHRSHVGVRKRPANASHASTPSTLPSLPTGIPTDLHLALLLNKTVLSSAAILVRQWLLTGHSEALHQAHHQHSAAPSTAATNADDTSSAPFVVQGTTLPLRIASPWAIATTVFVLAALGQALWLQVWTWLPSLRRSDPNFRVLPRKIGTLGVVMFVSTWVWLMALERLGPTTVIIFTQFCDVWMADLARSLRFRAHGSYIVVAGIMLSFVCQLIFPPSAVAVEQAASFPYDDLDNPLPPSLRHTRPMHLASPSTLRANSLRAELEAKAYSPSGLLFGHLLLVIFAVLSLERERATRNASLEAGGRRRAQVLACIAIAAPAFAASLMGVAVGLPSLPPLSSLIPSFDTSATTASGHSAAYILLAFGLLILEPLVGAALEPHATLTARVTQGWPLAVGAAIIVGKIGFSSRLLWSELVVALVVAYGIRSILKTSPVHALDDVEKSTAQNGSRMFSSNFDGSVRATHKRTTSDPALQDAWQSVFVFLAVAKDMVKKVWAKQDSRKIFQFLVLNLLFMFVQLVWGVWTNSLGLISDAIHMFFDCLAIGMGLLASVMQDWKHDRTFTYGYGRIETLSGFANGIFLLLISTFIVFEGIDRIVHPPEMHNTRQLLIVSSMGLGVNLFGMFAMGGHHHHGHGHSHGHSHGGHAHDHAHVDDHKGHHHHDDHSHDHAHAHAHSDHQHSHDDHDHDHYDHDHDHHDHDHHDHDRHDHDHSHDHGHHHHSHNMLGIYLHVMADTLGSVGVIISTLLIQYFGWTGFDPIASLVIAFLIVGSVIPLVIDAGRILCLDLGPNREVEVTSALDALKTIEGLASFSAPHFWPKDAETVVGTLRVQMTMMLVSVEATPSTTTTASTVSSTFSNGMSSKDTSLTSLASEASGGDDSPTFPTSAASAATPLSGTAAGATSNGISASASTSLNGVNGTSPPPTVPFVSPERLAAQVEALLKKRIHGLESLTVQCERSNVIIAPALNGHRTKLVAVQG